MRRYAKAWPERVWAVEGANGAGRPLAQRLLEAGEHVLDVPAKLAARVRLFDTGQGRKTDALDAHSIAVVAVRTKSLRMLQADGDLQALRDGPTTGASAPRARNRSRRCGVSSAGSATRSTASCSPTPTPPNQPQR